MGIMARMVVLRSGKIDQLPESRYKAVVVTNEAEENNTTNAEVWHTPGIIGTPPNESMGIRVSIGGGTSDVIVATKNKLEPPNMQPGESMFFSTDSDGETLKGNIKAKGDGVLEFNGNGKRLVTWQELQDALTTFSDLIKSHVHASFGTPSATLATMTVDITAAKTTTLKTGG